MGSVTHSAYTREALELLGAKVRLARHGRRMTVAELAERVGVSRTTIQHIERGDPTVASGTLFEAATIVGVALFHADSARRNLETTRTAEQLAVLPQSVRVIERDDDF